MQSAQPGATWKRLYSMPDNQNDIDEVMRLGQRALGRPVIEARRLTSGRNSQVYRLETVESSYVLKRYPADHRQRLENEARALRLMTAHALPVPELIQANPEEHFSLLECIDGVPVGAIGRRELDAAASFLERLHALRTVAELDSSHLAAEACLSVQELFRQIELRLGRLLREAAGAPDLRQFLNDRVLPEFEVRRHRVRTAMSNRELSLDLALAADKRTLSPSDFGFHNAIRRPDGSLFFIDFEYFGWDDPVKLTSDTALHPGAPMDSGHRAYLRLAAERIYSGDPQFGIRLDHLLPLYQLRWTLILLNEFLPAVWERRRLRSGSSDWSQAKLQQLERARRFIDSPLPHREHANA